MWKSYQAGIRPKEIFADKAYFRKNILDSIEAIGAEVLILLVSAYKNR